jgi:hypothetical protein
MGEFLDLSGMKCNGVLRPYCYAGRRVAQISGIRNGDGIGFGGWKKQVPPVGRNDKGLLSSNDKEFPG